MHISRGRSARRRSRSAAAIWIGGLVTRGESIGWLLGKKLFWALSAGNRWVWADTFSHGRTSMTNDPERVKTLLIALA